MSARALELDHVRRHAIAHTLFSHTTLPRALERLAFVQADPIRAPARAQDLILRHRVKAYRMGDLERRYPALNIDEGLLYAYGFLWRPLWHLRHPAEPRRLPAFERDVLDLVRERGEVHPEHLQLAFGRKRAINAWGSYSSVGKLALERLHLRGLLRVARRENGIRVYAPAPLQPERPPPADVFRELILAVTRTLAPISERSLCAVVAPFRRSLPRLAETRVVLRSLIQSEDLEHGELSGVRYLWPAGASRPARSASLEAMPRLRLLAPFDPLVWDRRRFEQLWGWQYRFEAYTPAPKRLRGYYALPLLWREHVVGWANVSVPAPGSLDVQLGFVDRQPRDPEFARALEAEIESLKQFLHGRR